MSEEGWEQKYVKEAFDTNWVVPMGPNVNAFEQDLANFANGNTDGSKLDRKVVCLSAGTAAVHLALLACGVGPGDEVRSPRGFLDLIGAYNRGEMKLDKNAKSIFESCFLCTNCVEACPASLPVDEMIENVRFDLAQKYGISWYKRLFFYLLRHRWIMDFAARLGYVFKSCGFKERDNDTMQPKFALPMLKKERLLPNPSKKSFLNSHPEIIKNGERQVGIFIGCMANYVYTDTREGLLKILKELGISAHLMKKQLCCAAPAYFTGDFATVEANAKKNIAYFEKVLESCEAIICPEATCSAMLKVDYERFFEHDEHWRGA